VSLLPNDVSPEGIAAAWETMNDETGMKEFTSGSEHLGEFVRQGAEKLGMELPE